SPRARAWMACAPEWPRQLIEAAPVDASMSGDPPLDLAMVEEATKAGVLRESRAQRPWRGVTYHIAPELRQSAINSLVEPLTTGADSLDFIRKELISAGTTMQRVGGKRLKYAPGLERWAQLALRAGSDQALGEFLNEQVSSAINRAEKEEAIAAP